MKCKIKMTDKVRPVEGSVVSSASGGGTGTCPECETPGVLLSIVGGFVRAHTVSSTELPENNPQPATVVAPSVKHGKGLSEPVTDLVDTGLRIGDPREAAQRRTVEIHGAAGTATVKVPRKVEGSGKTKSGKPRMTTKLVDVPATEENVRESLASWLAKKPRSEAGRKAQNEQVSALTRLLEAIMSAQVVTYDTATRQLVAELPPVGAQPALGATVDRAASHRGPTLVPGRDTAPRLRDPELPWDEPTDLRRNGEVRKSTTLDQPRGRDRFDRKITTVPEPKHKRTAAERRRYRREQRLLNSKGQ